jgi:tetratricopeptide (TPR) repeat protein
VRRLPQAIRLNANLVEAPSGRVVWSQAFEGAPTDAFVLQRQLAVQVAQAVGARLSAPPPHRVDAEAYQLYLQARELQTRSVSRNWRDVRDLYRSAVDRDPTFVQAWAALARSEANVANEAIDIGPADAAYTTQMLAPALAAAQRTISLDDGLAEPYLVRSLVYSWLGEWREAAAALHEGEARGGQGGAAFYRAVGYLEESRRARQVSTSLDPLSADQWTNLAFTCEYVGDIPCHLDAAQRAHDLAPQDSSATRGLVRALIARGRKEEAWKLIEQVHWQNETDLSSRLLRSQAGHGRAPQPSEVLAALDHGEYLDVAVGHLADMQDWDDAAHLLERWGPPSRSYIFALFRVQWAPLRRTPQFWALMQRSGLLQFWRETGRWPDFCEHDAGDVCAPYRR